MRLMHDAGILRILLPLLCLLSGCNRACQWKCHQTLTGSNAFDSALLKYIPENSFNGVEVQFLKGAFGMLGYLNVYAKPISSPHIILEINKEKRAYQATCMKGGQRLLLPAQATEELIAAILHEKEIKIHLTGYASTINAHGFDKLYQHFLKVNSY